MDPEISVRRTNGLCVLNNGILKDLDESCKSIINTLTCKYYNNKFCFHSILIVTYINKVVKAASHQIVNI